MYCLHWPACVDLLIISELINDVALAFTTGTGDLAGGAASKLGSLPALALSWSYRFTLRVSKQCHYKTHKQADKWDSYMHQAKSKFLFVLFTKFLNTGRNAPLQCSWTCAVGWQVLSIRCWHSCLRAGNAWGLPWAHHSWYCVESFQSVTIRHRRSPMMCRTQYLQDGIKEVLCLYFALLSDFTCKTREWEKADTSTCVSDFMLKLPGISPRPEAIFTSNRSSQPQESLEGDNVEAHSA